MISEKTVELNLTTELVNWLWFYTRHTFCSIAPSQRDEAHLGFDTAIVSNGSAFLIQYKKAHVDGNLWTYQLNRTKDRDQLYKLQILEGMGYPVFFALPHFHLPTEVLSDRRRLLLRTFWIPPSWIRPVGGPNGHHDLIFDTSSRTWSLHSDEESEIRLPLDYDGFLTAINQNFEKNNLMMFMKNYNKVFLESLDKENIDKFDYDILKSNLLIVKNL